MDETLSHHKLTPPMLACEQINEEMMAWQAFVGSL